MLHTLGSQGAFFQMHLAFPHFLAFAPAPAPSAWVSFPVPDFFPQQNVTFLAQLKCHMLYEAFPSSFSSVLAPPLQTPLEFVMKMMVK